jgi:tetratricopeptide (TPR) repeat protein
MGLLAALLAAGSIGVLRADTIYLKNGRRLQGTNTIRQDGQVTFDTAAGTMSVPESAVDRIVRDDSAAPVAVSNSAAAGMNMTPPASGAAEAAPASALQAIVRDGAIDGEALAEIDAKAATRNPADLQQAVEAESAASRFELNHNDIGVALQHAERALAFAPEQVSLLLNAAYLNLRRGDYQPALDLLNKARRSDSDSADLAKLAGWADYGLNRLSDTVAEWKHSQELHPDPEVAAALQKAQRDLDTDNAFHEGRSAHFDLHYYGGAAPELARDVLQTLEADFDEISGALNYTPQDPIAVALYTNQEFRDITQVPSWVGALNDGRIRIPVQGLNTVTPELARVLKHELTHSFITQKTHGRCPTWLQEGAAQWMEGNRTNTADAAELLALYNQHEDPSLSILEPAWMNLQPGFAMVAYKWSLAVVEAIESTSPGDLERILDRIDEGMPTENAMRATLHLSYSDLNNATADYLHKIQN